MTVSYTHLDYKVTDNLKVGFQVNGARMLPADTKSVATALRAAPVAHVFNSEYGPVSYTHLKSAPIW